MASLYLYPSQLSLLQRPHLIFHFFHLQSISLHPGTPFLLFLPTPEAKGLVLSQMPRSVLKMPDPGEGMDQVRLPSLVPSKEPSSAWSGAGDQGEEFPEVVKFKSLLCDPFTSLCLSFLTCQLRIIIILLSDLC